MFVAVDPTMNTSEAMLARRAVRSYTSRKVDDATLTTLLRAAVQAPSAMNRQPWLFAIIQDVAQLKRYSDHAKALLLEHLSGDPKASSYADRLRSPSFNIFYDASTLIVIGAAERGTYTDADCWLAAANLMLAATDSGLGTCPIGFAVPVLNLPETRAEIGLPPSGVAVAPILLGYPSAATPRVPRAEAKVVSWSR
jgi:nitroreductase